MSDAMEEESVYLQMTIMWSHETRRVVVPKYPCMHAGR